MKFKEEFFLLSYTALCSTFASNTEMFFKVAHHIFIILDLWFIIPTCAKWTTSFTEVPAGVCATYTGIRVLFRLELSNPVNKKTKSAHAASVIWVAQTTSANSFINQSLGKNSLTPNNLNKN